jgi:hypothetical protein
MKRPTRSFVVEIRKRRGRKSAKKPTLLDKIFEKLQSGAPLPASR